MKNNSLNRSMMQEHNLDKKVQVAAIRESSETQTEGKARQLDPETEV